MALVCPACRGETLVISASLELPRDSRSDEITLQIVGCADCDFEGLAVYEESGRGSFGTESVDHRAYRTPLDVVQEVRRALAKCPNPRNARCGCAAHRSLGKKDSQGRWVGLQRLELGPRLNIEYRRR